MNEILTDEQEKKILEILGYRGCMISGSKTAPKGHLAVFNCNIVIAGFGKVWYGDINITKNEKLLDALAQAFDGRTVYVLREMDGRFENEAEPKIDCAVYVTNGITREVSGDYVKYYHRDATSGKIKEIEDK